MAKAQKFETIEEVVAAMGVELNDQTRPFLESFVKKAGGGVSVGAKKKALFEEVEAMGVEGLKLDTETMDSLKVRGCQYLYTMGMLEELDEFANRFNLAVDHESGAVHRVKSKVKPIEERNAGKKEGTVGWLTIKMLQDERFADMPVTEMIEQFVEFAEELGYPDVKKTTAPSIQWYINYCRKTGVEVCERKRVARVSTASGDGKTLGAELTLEKALEPRNFKKKAVADTGSELNLDDDVQAEEATDVE